MLKTSVPILSLLGMLLASCASSPADGSPRSLRSSSAAIVNGTADAKDPAVVFAFIYLASGDEADCSGTIVSPHVVLTAAHCVDPSVLGAGATFHIFVGDNANDQAQLNDPENVVAVSETHFDPAYNGGDLSAGHDIGVIITRTAMTPTPLVMNRTALDSSFIGTDARVIGYGLTPDDASVAGEKFERTAGVTQVDANQITFDNVLCEGDSGGPSLATLNGQEVIVGVHSHGPTTACGSGVNAYDDRIDLYAASFVDPFIEAADPGFLPAADAGADNDASADDVAATPDAQSSSGCNLSPSRLPDRSNLAIYGIALALLARASRRRCSSRP